MKFSSGPLGIELSSVSCDTLLLIGDSEFATDDSVDERRLPDVRSAKHNNQR
jgi:hypothetical protein